MDIMLATSQVMKSVANSSNFQQEEQLNSINLASVLLLGFSNRNISEESEDVVISLMSLVDIVLDQPLDTLRNSQNSKNSSSK